MTRDVAAKHATKIARDSLRYACPMLGVVGGPRHPEAVRRLRESGERANLPEGCTCPKEGPK